MIATPRAGLWTPRGRQAPSLIGSMGVSGVSQLPRSLTINGTTVQATVVYDGRDLAGSAGSLTWPEHYGVAGGTLTEAGGGALTRSNAGPFTDGTTGGDGDGTGYMKVAGTTLGEIGTKDTVLELILNGTGSSLNLAAKRLSGSGDGWQIRLNPSGNLVAYHVQGGSSPGAQSDAPPAGVFHAICFSDRSGSAQWYLNGAASGGAVDISGSANAITNAGYLSVFATDSGGQPYPGYIWHFAMWCADAWLDTHLQAAVAAERCARAFGLMGHARVGAAYPTVTRASTRYFQVGSAIHATAVGAHAVEEDGAGDRFVGVYGERTNLCLQSQNLATTWAEEDAGDTTAATTLTADATDGNHGVTQAINLTAVVHTLSAEAEPGAKTWLYLSDDTVANCTAYFNLATGAVGTVGAGCTAKVVGKRGSKYRCSITFTGTAAAHTITVAPAHADTDRTFAGDGSTVSMTITNVQVEVGSCAGPIIPTTTAAVTKSAEVISLAVADFGIPGSVELHARTWDTVPTNKVLWSWDDADGDSAIGISLDASGQPVLTVNNGAGNTVSMASSVAINDGAWHRIVAAWSTDNCALSVDGTLARDVSCAMPALADLDASYLGSFGAAGYQFDGHIRELRAYKYRRI